MLWILALAEARSAVPISAAISAKRATKASAKINATLEGARQKGSWLRRSLVIPQVRDGDAPRLLLAICPSASTRDPSQHFNSLLGRGQMGASSLDPSFEALVQRLAVIPLHQEKGHRGLRGHDALQSARLACLPDRSDCDQSIQIESLRFMKCRSSIA